MPVSVRTDPVLGCNFLVSLIDSGSTLGVVASALGPAVLGGFSECSGLEGSLQVEEYKEGGRNDAVLKFPTRAQWGNLTLKRGVTVNTGLWDWYSAFVRGRGRRRDGVIVLQNDERAPVAVWRFARGFPVKWTGPALNAAQNAVAVEALEIAHEGLTWVSAGGDAMEVHIGEVNSTVRATDGTALLSPEVLRKIVAAVREALKSDREHEGRVADERKLTAGVSHDGGGGE